MASLPWARMTRGRSLFLGGLVLGGALLYLGQQQLRGEDAGAGRG